MSPNGNEIRNDQPVNTNQTEKQSDQKASASTVLIQTPKVRLGGLDKVNIKVTLPIY